MKLVALDANAKGKWVKVQPKTAAPVHGGRHAKPTYTNSGSPVWVEGSLANTTTSAIVAGWKEFPLSFSHAKGPGADFRDVFRRVDLDKAGPASTVKDDKGRSWFLVTIGAKDGSTRQGWVCEQDHPLVKMCGPWDWPGFELIDNSSIMPIDMLKRYIHVTQQYLADESKTEFEASAATVNAGALITNLEKAIDTDHDGKVTALELKHAQETPWMAEALSHLVVRSESEWGGGLGKWEALSPLMKKLLWLWKTEIERIGKLQWWEQVTGVEGFPKEPNPWHFHPIGMVGNFLIPSQTDSDDVTYLAKTLYGEARGQNRVSKEAVAWVIRNRVESGIWGKTYKSVVTAHLQFTCWSSKIDPGNYAAIQNPSGPVWEECKQVAEEVVSAPASSNPIPGAINYYSPRAQAALHATDPANYKALPPFADPAKRVPNPPGISDEYFKFYKK